MWWTRNLEIFRDFLAILPAGEDIVISIADLDIRVPEASSLLVERARSMGPARRLILMAAGPDPSPPSGV